MKSKRTSAQRYSIFKQLLRKWNVSAYSDRRVRGRSCKVTMDLTEDQKKQLRKLADRVHTFPSQSWYCVGLITERYFFYDGGAK